MRATADPTLDADGVRVGGTAWEGGAGRRLIGRVLVTDPVRRLVGFGSGAITGADPSDWRGFAVAPAGAKLVPLGCWRDRGFAASETLRWLRRPADG